VAGLQRGERLLALGARARAQRVRLRARGRGRAGRRLRGVPRLQQRRLVRCGGSRQLALRAARLGLYRFRSHRV
jgi:hypothetical protein